MIGIDDLMAQISGLNPRDVQRWIDNDWVRPGLEADAYVFQEIDVARIRLIRELEEELQIGDTALPVVLSLLDQLYAHRRRLRDISAALNLLASDELRRAIMQHVAQNSGAGDLD